MINVLEKEFLNSTVINQEKEDWRKDLSYKKFEYQKEKDLKKSQLESEKLKQQNAEARRELIKTIIEVLIEIFKVCAKITFWLISIPLTLGLAFLGGFFGGVKVFK